MMAVPPGHLCPREEQCAYCHEEGIGKMNIPSGPGTPQKPPRLEAEASSLKENITPPTHRGASPWEENFVSLAGLEGCWEN
jgi:hypothetical protein